MNPNNYLILAAILVAHAADGVEQRARDELEHGQEERVMRGRGDGEMQREVMRGAVLPRIVGSVQRALGRVHPGKILWRMA